MAITFAIKVPAFAALAVPIRNASATTPDRTA
jgi:hypothetical protein